MAKAIYVQKGHNIDYTAAEEISYMEVVPLISRIGVALEAIPKNCTGSVSLTGVYDLPAAASLEIAVGDQVFWNTTNNNIDKTDTGISAGMAVTAKASAGTIVRVCIG